MPKRLSLQEIGLLGIDVNGDRMENGEHRFRLLNQGPGGGFGYIMTVMPPDERGWQNSHHHEGIVETFIVQRGWIGFAELVPGGRANVSVYRPGAMFTSRPGHPHNVYMPASALIHTVKHGNCSIMSDWVGNAELDALTHGMNEGDIFAAARLGPGEIADLMRAA